MDIRVVLPDDTKRRGRRKVPVSAKSTAQPWGEARERQWDYELTHLQPKHEPKKEVPRCDPQIFSPT